jgi:3D (Asp-Asp-Asp) domain-containing protein
MSDAQATQVELVEAAAPESGGVASRSDHSVQMEASREAVRQRRSRLHSLVALRRVVLYSLVVGMTVSSAILAKEVRSAPALANIRVVVTEPPDSEPVEAVTDHAPDAPDLLERLVPLMEVPDQRALVFAEDRSETETAIDTWGDLVRDPSVRWFDGRPVRPAYTIALKVTAYSPDERSCGTSADGITATLHSVETNGHCLVAADPAWFPAGTLLSVPGYDEDRIVPVLDVGGAIKGRHIDVLYATHARARHWGVKQLKVTVWEYADGRPVVSPRKLR